MEDTPLDDDAPGASIVWEAETILGRRYVLERHLGRGANGNVWLARDQLLGKDVALKALDPELAKNRDTVRRFLREVALAHAVTHPHVVRIYDTGEEDGLPFFTMQYIVGKTLQERLDGEEGRMDFKEIRRVAMQVLEGLEAAHEVGVIHRDLKPGNVMLTHRGAIVVDFGVAGIEEAPRGDPSASSIQALVRTEAGTIFGSPAYMSPELWEGESASVRSDLFAFGVMLYQMITGRLPWSAKTPSGYLKQLASTRPPSIRALRSDTPWPVLRLCMRCLSTSVDERPSSAAAAIDLLSPLRSAGRRRLAVAAVAGVGALAAAAWWQTPWALGPRGLPDDAARMDLAAAVRMFDAGDDAAALRVLDRVGARAPRSAAVHFWQASIHHALEDPAGRAAACRIDGRLEGSAAWIHRAEAACGEYYAIAWDPASTPSEFVPLWIDATLLPALRDGSPDASAGAREVLAKLEARLENPPKDPLLPHRFQRARVDLELSLGRVDEAEQHLSDLTDAHPYVPLFATRLAWLASRRGQRDRGLALASRVFAVDPTPSLASAMDAGKMRQAWAGIEALGDAHPHRPHLRQLWCASAWRFEVTPVPSQCADLPPGFAQALWQGDGQGWVGVAVRARTADACTEPPASPTVFALAPWGFETTSTEAALRGALCSAAAGDPRALQRAREHASRLLAATPDNPWALTLAAEVAERSGDAPSAHAQRVAAAQRWRDADEDLPLVARVRRQLDDGPTGVRSVRGGESSIKRSSREVE